MLHLFADIGTPLVWFGLAYPFIGSLGVAYVENRLLQRFWGVQPTTSKWHPVLLGNLVTTAIGVALVNEAWVWGGPILQPRPLENVGRFSTIVWSAAFVLTVLIEAPFFAWAMRRTLASSAVWGATLGANSLSYAGLLAVSLFLGQNTLGKSVQVVQAASLKNNLTGWVYYIGPDDREIVRVRMDGSGRETVGPLSDRECEGLAVETVDGAHARLVTFRGDEATVVQDSVGKPGQAALWVDQLSGDPQRMLTPYRPDFQVPRYFVKPEPGGTWTSLRYGATDFGWADLGLSVHDKAADIHYRIAVGTPFLSWPWHNATISPNGVCIAEFGPQIVVLDITGRRIAWLANGRGPTVLLDRPVR